MIEVRSLGRKDFDEALALYVHCMSGLDYNRNKYMMRRALDRPELEDVLARAYGPILERAAAYGLSVGARENDRLVGFYICFWYKSVRDYDPDLFRKAFSAQFPAKAIEYMNNCSGSGLYGFGPCVLDAARRQGTALKMIDAVTYRNRPDWLAAEVFDDAGANLYRRRGASVHKLGNDRMLAVCPR